MEIDTINCLFVIVSQHRDQLEIELTIHSYSLSFSFSWVHLRVFSYQKKRYKRDYKIHWEKETHNGWNTKRFLLSLPLSRPPPFFPPIILIQCIHRKGMKPCSFCFLFFRELKVKGERGGQGSFKCPLLFVLTLTQVQLEMTETGNGKIKDQFQAQISFLQRESGNMLRGLHSEIERLTIRLKGELISNSSIKK